jgi:hypothetical protein
MQKSNRSIHETSGINEKVKLSQPSAEGQIVGQ